MSLGEFDRTCMYYACFKQDGYVIDWKTGEISPPPIRTLRQP